MKPHSKASVFSKLFSLLHRKRPSRDANTEKLERLLGYRFRNLPILSQSLTHKSTVSGDDRKGLQSNERLEFLGDAVLNCCVTEHLYRKYPTRSEGQLSKIKSLIVSRKILGQIAQSINLGTFLVLGSSEKDSGGAQKQSIVSNAFEAVLGAVYLDGGLDHAKGVLNRFLFPQMESFLKEKSNVNYKSKILELAQRDGFGVPRYSVISTWGPEHAKNFKVKIEVTGVAMGEGCGPNKKIAQQNAAEVATNNYDKQRIIEAKARSREQ